MAGSGGGHDGGRVNEGHQYITSRDNRLYRQWLSLQSRKGIERCGLALVSGRKIVPELLAARGGDGATLLLCRGDHENPPSLWEGQGRDSGERRRSRLSPSRLPPEGEESNAVPGVVCLAPALFDALDEFGTGAPLLVLPVPHIEKREAGAGPPRGLALAIAAQDPSNLGAILRSALAFEVSEVVLLAECAHPFLPRVTRAAAGANFHLKLSAGPSIQALGVDWIALDMAGEALDEAALPKDCALLMGEEGLGIPQGFAGRRIRIPIGPRAESLNVAVAAGIVLAAYRRRHPQ